MLTFVFPGQGSQSKGMGGTLFEEFTEQTALADQILGYSIKELCLEDPYLNLSLTQFTQPAIYVVNAFSYLKRLRETGRKPDFVAGHSLGEYNALLAAEVFDFETGLRLVKRRGELMGKATGGGMAAVIGITEEQIAEILNKYDLQTLAIANLNSPYQIVISGPKGDIGKAESIFMEIKDVKMFTSLKTSGAFHSCYMEAAKENFQLFIKDFYFQRPTIPVISNVSGRPCPQTRIGQTLVEQITHPVKWTESIRYLMGFGEMDFAEIGSGKILTGLIQRIKRETEPLAIPNDEKERILNGIDPEAEMEHDDRPLASVTATEIKRIQETPASNIEPEELETCRRGYPKISAGSLGSFEFKKDYNLKYAYLSGGMYRGIASGAMVVKMGKAGMMGFFGTGGLELSQIEAAIKYIQQELSDGQAYGINLVHNINNPALEESTVDIFIALGVRNIEAAAFLQVTPALVRYRAQGLERDASGKVHISNKIMAKVSRPEVAKAFLSPAPERLVAKLVAENKISPEKAALLKEIPMADHICVEADSGGHTDGGVAYALMPAMTKLRNEMMAKYQYPQKVGIGAAGGIGTPEAAAAAFMLGADFIMTGSINQCTVEAAVSDRVKDLLQQLNVQDTEYAPAGDMFELGAKVQVVKKGVFFPARANKLFEVYRQYNSLEEIDTKTKRQITEKYFKRSFEKVYEDVKNYYPAREIEQAEQNPKYKMALVFRWYFGYSSRLALTGNEESVIDYQIHCGPSLGAFNQWIKGTNWEDWRNRHVDEIGLKMMNETAMLLNQQFTLWSSGEAG
jgi:trans-AT polyketide synthase/acyltransferase/oxidoreductase domain-containing protein